MRKIVVAVLVLSAAVQGRHLEATTVIQVYPTFGGPVFGRLAAANTFEGSPILDDAFDAMEAGKYSAYNLPIEIRRTIAEIDVGSSPWVADLMFAGGASLFFENGAFSSVNLSAGLTFGYGYDRNKLYDGGRVNVTLFPVYEFPLAIFWKTPHFPWKFATEVAAEILRIGPVSFGGYARGVMFPTRHYSKKGFASLISMGLSVGAAF